MSTSAESHADSRCVLVVLSDAQREELAAEFDHSSVRAADFHFEDDPEDALDRILEIDPSLVFVGMQVGPMDGLEFLALLMQRYRTFAGKVVVVPARDDPFPPVTQQRDAVTGRSATVEIDFDEVTRLIRGMPDGAPMEASNVGNAPRKAPSPAPRRADAGPSTAHPHLAAAACPTPSAGVSKALRDEIAVHLAETLKPQGLADLGRPTPLVPASKEHLRAAAEFMLSHSDALAEPAPMDRSGPPIGVIGSEPPAAGPPQAAPRPPASAAAPVAGAETELAPDLTAAALEPPLLAASEQRSPAAPPPAAQALGQASGPGKGRLLRWLIPAGISFLLLLLWFLWSSAGSHGSAPQGRVHPPALPAAGAEASAPEPSEVGLGTEQQMRVEGARPRPEPPEVSAQERGVIEGQAQEQPQPIAEPPPASDVAPARLSERSLSSLPIRFDGGRAQGRVIDEAELAALIASSLHALRGDPHVSIEVGGHTSNEGSGENHQRIAQRRARWAISLLVERGLPQARLHPFAYGTSEPAVDGSRPVALARNRRVTLRLVR